VNLTCGVVENACAKYGVGEMHFIPTDLDSWYDLPRNGGIAYAAQESWVQNETIRNNILFGNTYDEERYYQGEHLYPGVQDDVDIPHFSPVIKQCALERDLELFEAGDNTEVGERGLTLRYGVKKP